MLLQPLHKRQAVAGWFQAEDATKGGRAAYRAQAVRGECERRHSRGHSHCAAACRASRRAFQIPRIPRDSVCGGLSETEDGKFGHCGLANYDRSSSAQPAYKLVVSLDWSRFSRC